MHVERDHVTPMRFVYIYLIAYFAVVFGALVALQTGGAFQHIPLTWLLIGLTLAVGFGILLAVSSRSTKPNVPSE